MQLHSFIVLYLLFYLIDAVDVGDDLSTPEVSSEEDDEEEEENELNLSNTDNPLGFETSDHSVSYISISHLKI